MTSMVTHPETHTWFILIKVSTMSDSPLAPEDYEEPDRPVNHWAWASLSFWMNVTLTQPLHFLHTYTPDAPAAM